MVIMSCQRERKLMCSQLWFSTVMLLHSNSLDNEIDVQSSPTQRNISLFFHISGDLVPFGCQPCLRCFLTHQTKLICIAELILKLNVTFDCLFFYWQIWAQFLVLLRSCLKKSTALVLYQGASAHFARGLQYKFKLIEIKQTFYKELKIKI